MNAAEIAASIDTSTVAGHNLRALLLRREKLAPTYDYDADPAWADEASDAALQHADALRLVDIDVRLTPLGREVAELLRPKPWRARELLGGVYLARPNTSVACIRGALTGEVGRIADLLTADDLRAAKTYRSEP